MSIHTVLVCLCTPFVPAPDLSVFLRNFEVLRPSDTNGTVCERWSMKYIVKWNMRRMREQMAWFMFVDRPHHTDLCPGPHDKSFLVSITVNNISGSLYASQRHVTLGLEGWRY